MKQTWQIIKRTMQRSSVRRAVKGTSAVVALLLVFLLGISVGNGQIHLSFAGPHTENPSLPERLNYASVDALYNTLKANYDGKLTADQLENGLKQGLAEATADPYTQYFTADQAKKFESQLNNSFSGIGAELGKDADGNMIIVSPIKGSPADKAGLLPHDIIVSINNESTASMAIDAAVSKIRGPKDTQVTLKLLRNKTDTLTLTITRDTIQLPSVTNKILDGNIGYIQISSFSEDTVRLATAAAQSLQQAHVKGIILDLRGNPGGYLDAAVGVSSLWLPEGQTVVTVKGTGGEQDYTATGNDLLHNLPTVVLINDGSASASEITAGALHDNQAAHLIGIKSFGKGVVQDVFNFPDGSELKVTTASWYRPNGQNIQKQGITPDQVVSLSDAAAKAGNDTQLQAAQAYLSK